MIGRKPQFGFARMHFEESGLTYEEWATTTDVGKEWAAKYQGPSFRSPEMLDLINKEHAEKLAIFNAIPKRKRKDHAPRLPGNTPKEFFQ